MLLLCAASACAPTPDAAEAEGEESTSIESAGAALSTSPNSTFYRITRPDVRRCAYPICGGAFAQRVNQRQTRCADGTMQAECRIVEFDYAALKLSAAEQTKLAGQVRSGQALLLGEIQKTTPIAGTAYDKLVVTEAWQARGLVTRRRSEERGNVSGKRIRCLRSNAMNHASSCMRAHRPLWTRASAQRPAVFAATCATRPARPQIR